jgi:hypothetical protein
VPVLAVSHNGLTVLAVTRTKTLKKIFVTGLAKAKEAAPAAVVGTAITPRVSALANAAILNPEKVNPSV